MSSTIVNSTGSASAAMPAECERCQSCVEPSHCPAYCFANTSSSDSTSPRDNISPRDDVSSCDASCAANPNIPCTHSNAMHPTSTPDVSHKVSDALSNLKSAANESDIVTKCPILISNVVLDNPDFWESHEASAEEDNDVAFEPTKVCQGREVYNPVGDASSKDDEIDVVEIFSKPKDKCCSDDSFEGPKVDSAMPSNSADEDQCVGIDEDITCGSCTAEKLNYSVTDFDCRGDDGYDTSMECKTGTYLKKACIEMILTKCSVVAGDDFQDLNDRDSDSDDSRLSKSDNEESCKSDPGRKDSDESGSDNDESCESDSDNKESSESDSSDENEIVSNADESEDEVEFMDDSFLDSEDGEPTDDMDDDDDANDDSDDSVQFMTCDDIDSDDDLGLTFDLFEASEPSSSTTAKSDSSQTTEHEKTIAMEIEAERMKVQAANRRWEVYYSETSHERVVAGVVFKVLPKPKVHSPNWGCFPSKSSMKGPDNSPSLGFIPCRKTPAPCDFLSAVSSRIEVLMRDQGPDLLEAPCGERDGPIHSSCAYEASSPELQRSSGAELSPQKMFSSKKLDVNFHDGENCSADLMTNEGQIKNDSNDTHLASEGKNVQMVSSDLPESDSRYDILAGCESSGKLQVTSLEVTLNLIPTNSSSDDNILFPGEHNTASNVSEGPSSSEQISDSNAHSNFAVVSPAHVDRPLQLVMNVALYETGSCVAEHGVDYEDLCYDGVIEQFDILVHPDGHRDAVAVVSIENCAPLPLSSSYPPPITSASSKMSISSYEGDEKSSDETDAGDDFAWTENVDCNGSFKVASDFKDEFFDDECPQDDGAEMNESAVLNQVPASLECEAGNQLPASPEHEAENQVAASPEHVWDQVPGSPVDNPASGRRRKVMFNLRVDKRLLHAFLSEHQEARSGRCWIQCVADRARERRAAGRPEYDPSSDEDDE
ncbi:uncharacterized protein LOC108664490 isoform X2 [Hyalella azteca]|uniref:Uncharacterized protein LOC108664490 isoform X2 n=1 Tax=Hyalella azteca TaxID=294128 RepID=A0A979FWK2_HYAAZ|nr:uncharacterized protein LOC108664490 isoform X2 [Hyalella azteca]